MIAYLLLFYCGFWTTVIIILIISLIIVSILGYFVFFKYERELVYLYPRKRNPMETFIFRKLRMEFFKQDKQIESIKLALSLTLDSRNLVKRLSEEMKNIESLYSDQESLRNLDLEIFRELSSNLESVLDKLESLISTKREYMYPEFLNMLRLLNERLTECSIVTKSIFALSPKKIDKNFFSECTQKIEINYVNVKNLHDNLIENFRNKFSKGIL